MTPAPDKLFRDRLEPLKTPPPPAAWDRIAAAVEPRKPRRRGLIISAFAFIVLLCAGAYLIIDPRTSPDQTPKQVVPETQSPAMAQSPSPEIQPGANPVITPTAPVTSSSQRITYPRKETHSVSTAVSADAFGNTSMETPPVSIDAPNDSLQSTIAHAETRAVAVIDNPVGNQMNKKITYTADDVNARFKRKPKPTAIDTANKAPSALQRVLDVAYEFKYENTMLGDLRQMKDELFTSNGNGPARDK
jgi:hypothetical protein